MGNVLEDAKEIIHGFSTFVGGGLHDIHGLVGTALTGDTPKEGFVFPRMVSQLPEAFVADVKNRYGPLVRGDFEEFGQKLYEDPLFFATDILGGATLAQKGIQRFAPNVTRGVRTLASAERLQRALDYGAYTGEQAKWGKALLAGADIPQSARTLRSLIPEPRFTIAGHRVIERPGFQNPILRAVSDRVERKLFNEPVDVLRNTVETRRARQSFADELDERGLTELEAGQLKADEFVLGQAEKMGLGFVPREKVVGVLPGLRHLNMARILDREVGAFRDRQAQGIRLGHEAYPQTVREIEEAGLPAVKGYLGEIRRPERIQAVPARLPEPGQIRQTPTTLEEIGAGLRAAPDVETVDRLALEAITKPEGIELLRGLRPEIPGIARWIGDELTEGTRIPVVERFAANLRTHVDALRRMEEGMLDLDPQAVPLEYEAARLHTSGLLRTMLDTDDSAVGRAYRDHALWVDEELTRRLLNDRWTYQDILKVRFSPLRKDLIRDWYTSQADGNFDSARVALQDHLKELSETRATFGKGAAQERRIIDGEISNTLAKLRNLRRAHKRVTGEEAKPLAPYVNRKTGDWLDVPGSDPMHIARRFYEQNRRDPLYYPEVHAGKPSASRLMWRDPGMGELKVTRPTGRRQRTGEVPEKWIDTRIEHVYMRRLTEEVTLQELRGMMRELEFYGRPIKGLEDIGPGEVLVLPDYISHMVNGRRAIVDKYFASMEDAVLPDEALRDAVGEFMPGMMGDAMNSALGWAEGKGRKMAVPRVVADRLQKHLHRKFSWPMQLFFDQPLSAWRAVVLSGRPAWVLNNVLGNTGFLGLGIGGGYGEVLRQVPGVLAEALQKRFPQTAKMLEKMDAGYLDQVKQVIAQHGGEINAGFFRNPRFMGPQLSEAAMEHPIGQMGMRISKSPLAQRLRNWSDNVRNLNSEIEDLFRRAAYMTAAEKVLLRRGVTRVGKQFHDVGARLERINRVGADPQLARETLDMMNAAMNDYRTLTPVESQVVRRFIAPFWSFYRHVVRMMALMPFEHPDKFLVMRNMSEVGREVMAELGEVPEYAESAYPVGPGISPGFERFLSARAANPFEGVLEPEQWLTMLNPALKIILEQAQGRSVFTGRPFTSPEAVIPFGFDQPFGMTSEGVRGLDEPVRPNILEHLAQQIPHYEMLKDLLAGGRTYDTSTLLDVLADPEGAVIAEGGQPRYPIDLAKTLSRLFGFSEYDVDLDAYQERQRQGVQAAQAQLSEYLRGRQ